MKTLTLTIREANPETEYERVAELISAASVEPVSAKNLVSWDKNLPSGLIRRRAVGVTEDGQIVAYNVVQRLAKDVERQRFSVWVTVDSAHRKQGIGTQMLEDAVTFARANGARELSSEVMDNHAESRHFAEKRGYQIHKHTFTSRLDLTTFDERPFEGIVEKATANALRFSSLAAEGNTPEAQFKLYTLNNQTAQDNPSSDNEESFPTFEVFQHHVLNADWFRADGQILAIEGDRYVGLGAVGLDDDRAYSAFTGVDKEYRERGIAQALKLLTIRFAIAHGARCLLTDNDSQNAPMLRINRKFGFQPEPGLYKLRRTITTTGIARNTRIWLTL